jgi:hypothetical protein
MAGSNIYVPWEVGEAVRWIAKHEGRTMSQVLKRAVRLYQYCLENKVEISVAFEEEEAPRDATH